MRHGKKIHKIGRDASHRKATLQSMSAALIAHKRITTTLGKARALRVFVEPILHRAKDDSTASRRQAFRGLQDKEAVKALFGDVAQAIGSRPGGYTRIVKLGQRGGDAAEMAIIELVDFNDVKPDGAAGTKRKTRRSRRAGGTAAAAPAAVKAAPVAEARPAEEAPAAEEAPEAVAEDTVVENAAAEETTEETMTEAEEAPAADVSDEAPSQDAEPPVPTDPDAGEHGDAEQGAPTGVGEPPPEAGMEDQAGHRG